MQIPAQTNNNKYRKSDATKTILFKKMDLKFQNAIFNISCETEFNFFKKYQGVGVQKSIWNNHSDDH